MKKYYLLVLALVVIFTALFVLFEALQIPIVTDPSAYLNSENFFAGLVGILLLIIDILLPIPSSLVMVGHGALYGVVIGTVLSLIGSMGAFIVGYYLGKVGSPIVKRLISTKEFELSRKFLEKWGVVAIALTRPIPILAETTAILTGASSLNLGKSLLAAVAGSFPIALIYALTGAVSANFNNTALMFVFILIVTGVIWFVSRKVD